MRSLSSTACVRWSTAALCALAIWSGRFSLPAPLRTQQALAQGLDYRGPDKAPPSWRQFAKLVQYRFETWIGADEEIANRLRAYLIDRAGKEDGPPPTLVCAPGLTSTAWSSGCRLTRLRMRVRMPICAPF
jgi:hypothetical protein